MHWLEVADSTNTRCKELARTGAPHGTVIIAGQQTGGRGRMGRSFSSPAGGGVYLSALIRPKVKPEELMHLTCAVGVAMCQAVEAAAGLKPNVKWINDLVVRNRKLGGILVEMGFLPDGTVDYAVIGVGINCCQQTTDFPEELQSIATSLALEGADCAREVLAARMVEALAKLDKLLISDKAALMRRYRRLCVTTGNPVQVLCQSASREAYAVAVLDDGSLLVRYPDGQEEAVHSGEVSVRGMYGYI